MKEELRTFQKQFIRGALAPGIDVSAAVRRLNQDSGYRVRRGTANRGSTSWRHRVPFSTVCGGGGS